MQHTSLYIVFSDLSGFSKLSNEQLVEYHQTINVELAKAMVKHKNTATVWNTWGDAIFAAFSSSVDVVAFLLEYRDFFSDKSIGDNNIIPRVAAHFGEVYLVNDPLNDNKNIYGTNVNSTARMEPVTRPGEIFVSQAFKTSLENTPHQNLNVEFDEVGNIALAKKFGECDAFRLRRGTEKPHILDKLAEEKLIKYMPTIAELEDDEDIKLKEVIARQSKESLTREVNSIESGSLKFWYLVAERAKEVGAYELCLELLDRVENDAIEVDGVSYHPYKHTPEFKTLKANALTRLGDYQQAADIVYGLWHSGHKSTDTLCMLAAQYKRRAIFGKNKTKLVYELNLEDVNHNLLERAFKLYQEAFRRDFTNYYPAINAAYLFKIKRNLQQGNGNKIASYIRQVWEDSIGESWWLDCSLAEALVIMGDYEDAINEFTKAIAKHQPSAFERAATKEQIEIYAALSNNTDMVEEIIRLLG